MNCVRDLVVLVAKANNILTLTLAKVAKETLSQL